MGRIPFKLAAMFAGALLAAPSLLTAQPYYRLATELISPAPPEPGARLSHLAPAASAYALMLEVENATLDEVLAAISRQAGVRIMYGEDVLDHDRRVTIHLYGASLDEALRETLRGTGLVTRSVSTNAILVTRATAPEAPAIRQGTVTGRVIDAASLRPLAGALVQVIGTGRGTLTDGEGRFNLPNVPDGPQRLQVTFIGFSPQEQSVTILPGQTATVNFSLEPQALQVEGVVVVGYATELARNVTGAVTTVRAEELNTISTLSVNQMLQGRAPGLNLATRSAQPGGGVSANIRGAISPRGNNTPLYVIDGVPMTEFSSSHPQLRDSDLGFGGGVDRDPLGTLNPSDIESITVLKDASSTAIYGSAAANGVVLITTKGGRVGDVQVQYTTNYTTERVHDYFPMLNAQQFMQEQSRLSRERWLYENQLAPYGTRNPAEVPAYIPLFTESQMASAGVGTDWVGLVTRNGQAREHNLALRGGAENTRAFLSFNYRGNDPILRNSSLGRYTGRLNLDQTVSSAVRLSLRMSAGRLQGQNASTGSNSGGPEKYNMMQTAFGYAPTVPVYDENGNFAYSYNRLVMNPAAFLIIDDNSRTTNLFATPTLEVDLTSALRATVAGQFNQETSQRNFYLPRTTNNDPLPDGMAQKSEQTISNYSTEGYLTYGARVGAGELSLVGGAGYYEAETEGSSMQGVGFFSDAFSYNNLSVSSEKLRNAIESWRSARTKLSQFGRVNYTLNDRYILSLVARRDGSSTFSEAHKYGFFPGISAAWIVSDEAFLQGFDQLAQLKLRAGYGVAGNESVLSGNTLQLYSPGYPFLIGSTTYNGVALSQIANPSLSWEKISTLNMGVDFGLWRHRLSGSVDYFVKTGRDLLDFNPLPANNAVGRVADNVGATRSRGVELALNGRIVEAASAWWSSDLSVSHSRNHWLERNPQVPLAPYIGEQDPMDAIYGWQTDGIIRTDADRPDYMPNARLGNIRYVDQNGDGILDQQDIIILGNGAPRWVLGLNNTFGFRNLDFSVFAYGNLGYKRNNNFAPSGGNISQTLTPANTTIFARDIWSSTNPTGIYPGIADNPYNGQNPAGNDFNLRDASFVRLGHITAGYRVPQSLLTRLGTGRTARVYVNAQNLGVFTRFPGFDPEYTEANPYPKYYSTTIGIDLDF